MALRRVFGMRAAGAAALALLLIGAPARAEDECPDLTSDLRGMTLKYQRIMVDLQDARRGLTYLPRGEEAVLRVVGRFSTLSMAARAERERILVLYRMAVVKECRQFERSSLEQTADLFARSTAGEDETLAGTRRVLSGLSLIVK